MKSPKPTEVNNEDEQIEMEPSEATRFRRGVARIVYMAQDRLDFGIRVEGIGQEHGEAQVRR